MGMSLVSAATEVSKIIGGQGTSTEIDLATTAVKAALNDWNAAKEWNFLLKDTTLGFSVTGVTATQGSAVIQTFTDSQMDGVNIGVTVTIGAGTATLAAGTTVLSYTRGATGSIATVTLSNAFGGTTDTNATINFGADIPVILNVNEYNLPTDFNAPYGARLLTNKRQLEYIKYREWNRKTVDQSATGSVEAYTIYNPVSPLTQNFRRYRMRVFRTPGNTDTISLQYFRTISTDATNVDIPDAYLYHLLDYAMWRYIRLKNTEDSRLPHLFEVAQRSLALAMTDDEENSEEEELRMISQMEAWNGQRTLWTNGNFYPTQLDY